MPKTLQVGELANPPTVRVEDDRTGLTVETLRRAFTDHLTFTQAKDEHTDTARDRFLALAYTVRDRLLQRWIYNKVF